MRQSLLISLLFISLISCKKEMQPSSASEITANKSHNKAKAVVSIESLNDVYYDSCIAQNITLTGSVVYSLEQDVDNGYFIDYIISCNDLTGVDENGNIYHGKLKYEGRVSVSPTDDAKGKMSYSLKLTSPGGRQLNVVESSRFVLVNGVIKIDRFSTSASCK